MLIQEKKIFFRYENDGFESIIVINESIVETTIFIVGSRIFVVDSTIKYCWIKNIEGLLYTQNITSQKFHTQKYHT